MATVPIIEPTTPTRALPAGNLGLIASGNDPVAAAVGNAGRQAEGVALKFKERGDTIAVMNAQKAMNDWEEQNLYNPNGGAFTLKGANAIGSPQKYIGQFQNDMQGINDSLANDEQKMMFQKMAFQRRETLGKQLFSHERQQLDIYANQSVDATVSSNIARAEQNFNNPDIAASAISTATQAVAVWGKEQGLPQEMIDEKVREVEQKGNFQVLGRKAVTDPASFLAETRNARTPETIATGLNVPRGIRNNNPGNIKAGDDWQGADGADDKGYVKFKTPQDGLRALGINLKNQQDKHGLDTIDAIIDKYAPPTENDTEAYKAALAKSVGKGVKEKLDLHDEKTLSAVMAGIVQHENGQQPYGDQHIDAGAQAALGKEQQVMDGTAPIVPGEPAKTGNPAFDSLKWQEQQQLIRTAESTMREGQMKFRTQLESRVKDSLAMAATGAGNPNPVQLHDFVAAYGPEDGEARYNQYAELHNISSATNEVMTQTPEQQAVTLKANEPKPGPGYAQQLTKYTALVKATQEGNKARNEDPMAFAQQRGILDGQPLSVGNITVLQSQLQERAAAADTMAQTYGTPPVLMTKAEARQFSEVLANSSSEDRLAYLRVLRDGAGSPELYQATLQQIRPDSPTTALAGMYLGLKGTVSTADSMFGDTVVKPDEVARRLIVGEQLLNPTKTDKEKDGKGKLFPMPPDGNENNANGLRYFFDSYTKDAFRGSPTSQAQAYQAFRSYYAASAAEEGDYSGVTNPDIADKAVRAVIGGVTTKNAKSFIRPWGMDETAFNDVASLMVENKAKANSVPLDWETTRLDNVPGTESSYYVSTGAGYVLDKSGKPMRIDVSQPTIDATYRATIEGAKVMTDNINRTTAERKAERIKPYTTPAPKVVQQPGLTVPRPE